VRSDFISKEFSMNEKTKSLTSFSYDCHYRDWGDGNWQPVSAIPSPVLHLQIVVTYLPDTQTWWVKRALDANFKARPMRLSPKAGWGKFIAAVRKLMAE
jgi:hypothetical protein